MEPNKDKWADISECGQYRWALHRYWDSLATRDLPRVLWVMLNPSTADAQINDPTILRIMGFSERWGFGSLSVVNLYPFRSSSPKVLRQWLANGSYTPELRGKNREVIAREASGCMTIVAAYGNVGSADFMSTRALLASPLAGRDALCIGRTKNGSPIHPLARGKWRVPDNVKPMSYVSY